MKKLETEDLLAPLDVAIDRLEMLASSISELEELEAPEDAPAELKLLDAKVLRGFDDDVMSALVALERLRAVLEERWRCA
jgi:hypothetical protein